MSQSYFDFKQKFNEAVGGKFLSSYLEKNMNLLVTEYTPVKSFSDGTLIPVLPESLDLGDDSAYYQTLEYFDQTGDDGVDTESAPIVDFSVGEGRAKVYLIKRRVQYRYVDVERSFKAGRNGSQRLNLLDIASSAAIRGIGLDANRIAALGRRGGSEGLYNAAGIQPVAPLAFNPYQAIATPDDVYDFITEAINAVLDENLIEDDETDAYAPDTLVFPNSLRRVIRNAKFQGTAVSIINSIKEDYPSIKRIHFSGLGNGTNQLKYGVGDGTLDSMLAYKSHPHVLNRCISDVRALPPAWDGEQYTQVFMQAVTATNIVYPGFIRKVSYANGN